MSWTAANVLCQSTGGNMVAINSQVESDSLNLLLGNSPTPPFGPNAHWLGLQAGSNINTWTNGDPITFTNYSDNSYLSANGEYMYIQTNGQWDNAADNGRIGPSAGIYALMEICSNSAPSCTGPDITGLSVSSIIDNRVELNFDNMNSYDATGAQVCRVDQIRIKYREVGTSSWSQKNMASPTVSYTHLTLPTIYSV